MPWVTGSCACQTAWTDRALGRNLRALSTNPLVVCAAKPGLEGIGTKARGMGLGTRPRCVVSAWYSEIQGLAHVGYSRASASPYGLLTKARGARIM
jgi:hypothetical protein